MNDVTKNASFYFIWYFTKKKKKSVKNFTLKAKLPIDRFEKKKNRSSPKKDQKIKSFKSNKQETSSFRYFGIRDQKMYRKMDFFPRSSSRENNFISTDARRTIRKIIFSRYRTERSRCVFLSVHASYLPRRLQLPKQITFPHTRTHRLPLEKPPKANVSNLHATLHFPASILKGDIFRSDDKSGPSHSFQLGSSVETKFRIFKKFDERRKK